MMSRVSRGGEDGAVAGGGMVGVGVGDQRAGDRADRVDVEVARRAVEALGAGDEEVGGAHAAVRPWRSQGRRGGRDGGELRRRSRRRARRPAPADAARSPGVGGQGMAEHGGAAAGAGVPGVGGDQGLDRAAEVLELGVGVKHEGRGDAGRRVRRAGGGAEGAHERERRGLGQPGGAIGGSGGLAGLGRDLRIAGRQRRDLGGDARRHGRVAGPVAPDEEAQRRRIERLVGQRADPGLVAEAHGEQGHAHRAVLAQRREGADGAGIDPAAGGPERDPGGGERGVGRGGRHPAPPRQAARLAHQGAPLGSRQLGQPGAVQRHSTSISPSMTWAARLPSAASAANTGQGGRVVVVEPVGHGELEARIGLAGDLVGRGSKRREDMQAQKERHAEIGRRWPWRRARSGAIGRDPERDAGKHDCSRPRDEA